MQYGIRVIIKGDYACFSRPELKVERVSYEVITPSAARGILEAIFWKPAIKYVIDEIAVCNRIKFENIRRNEINSKIPNYSIESAKQKHMTGSLALYSPGDRAQRASMVLRNVNYAVTAHFEMTDRAGPDDNEDKFTAMLYNRLKNGKHYHMPYLGAREFPANVSLATDDIVSPPIEESRQFGLMLYDIEYIKTDRVAGNNAISTYRPTYFMAEMVNGVIDLRNVEVHK